MATATGGGQPRGVQVGVAVPGGVERAGMKVYEGTRDRQLAHSHGLLPRVQHGRQDGCARCGVGYLRAGALAVCVQVQRQISADVFFRTDPGGSRTIACSGGV